MLPRLLPIVAIALFLAAKAVAQPMVFSLESMEIVTTRSPEELSPPKKKSGKSDEKKATAKDKKEKKKTPISSEPVIKRHRFSTETYPMSVTNIGWFSNRAALPEGRAIMIVLENRDELALGWSNVTTPYDVLFVQGNGKIQYIVPNLVLGELSDPLEITGRIKAVMYLRAGTAKALDIRPGDRVEHALFKPSPLILQSPK